MATVIPAIGACSSRMTAGERRFASRLEDKLENDYLCWYDVPIGERTQHPDFVILHPRRGLLVLELKDWRLDTLRAMDKQHATIVVGDGVKQVLNPLEQARQYMYVVVNRLERDPQLVWPSGSLKGKPAFPYAHGVVLCNITRKQLNSTDLNEVLPEHLVICQDEMVEAVDSAAFQERLWQMFPIKFNRQLTLPQIDRIRWHLFPEVRIDAQRELFDDEPTLELPDVLRVMDLQQEQLARSLGDGHRVIHGVAGSGKTLILGYRAEHLARTCERPILVLCYNKTLAAKLASLMEEKGLSTKVTAVNFHAWCVRQLDAFHVEKPPQEADKNHFSQACVEKVIQAVDQGHIPSGQYEAILVDEGHDFRPEWFKLIVQMVNPASNSLLVLYDDAQSIYNAANKLKFSFSSVGVQAKGRTTILKLNYRNTAEVLTVAKAFADDLLAASDGDEDQVPVVPPMSAGRHGPKPVLIELPDTTAEIELVADRVAEASRLGVPWSDIAILYRRYALGRDIAEILGRRGIPFFWQYAKGRKKFEPTENSVKVITLHSSKGLEFPFVCMPGIGAIEEGDDLEEEARLLYVGMTRSTCDLVMTHSGTSVIAEKMRKAMRSLQPL
ncbi:nuclease-related domain-containing DEAD/DEAH box helicase [Massilia terrae]|uniref:NERD domain-containing protein n=1 Tax=Massilia terrae TaxID=1811224 RepID=A0ABT2CVP6_9BURK|nr:3'-5' exonuclease [Massilia terrae]MCS0658053.1 NERD domain-containing protein [Massilia terrae]